MTKAPLALIVNISVKYKIPLESIICGHDAAREFHGVSDEPPEADAPDDLSESDRERIRKVKEVFQSRDEAAKAVLRKGIDGLTIEDRVARLESEVAAIKYGQEEILRRLKEPPPPGTKKVSSG